MKQPKVIFLDAVGTLFSVRGTVGEVYCEIAERFGVKVSADVVNEAFSQSFKSSPPPVFPEAKPEDIPKCEFEWWQEIALRTFHRVGVLHEFPDFAVFFNALYNHFATSEPWVVYPDVRLALRYWRKVGIELGIISNFDSRIHSVLAALDLEKFFTSVTISSIVGVAKPSRKIFIAGLEKHNCSAEAAWHIGDSLKEDYRGAKAAGLRPILIRRTHDLGDGA